MAPLVEPAVPTLLSSISANHIGKKLRVVGTMIGHDVLNDLLLLADRELSKAILVDASVIIASTRNLPWLRGGKATIMVSGYLDPADDTELTPPELLSWTLEPRDTLKNAVLRASIINDASDLDWPQWNVAVNARNDAGLSS